jgi:hypothetical protein
VIGAKQNVQSNRFSSVSPQITAILKINPIDPTSSNLPKSHVPNPAVCAKAATAIGKLHDPKLSPTLLTALTAESPLVRQAIIQSLGQIGATAAIPELITALTEPNPQVSSNTTNRHPKFHRPNRNELADCSSHLDRPQPSCIDRTHPKRRQLTTHPVGVREAPRSCNVPQEREASPPRNPRSQSVSAKRIAGTKTAVAAKD